MVDVNTVLKDVVKKGKIVIGEKQTKGAITKGEAKIIITATNCQYTNELTKLCSERNIPLFQYPSDNVELGYTCGKSYAVSAFAVLDEKDTNVLQLISKRKK